MAKYLGKMYPAAGVLSWRDGVDKFVAGTRAEVLILPKDAFGNNVSSITEGSRRYNFSLSALTSNGVPADILNTSFKGWNQQEFLCIEFVTATAGRLLLHVEIENQTLHESPLPFTVNPGDSWVNGLNWLEFSSSRFPAIYLHSAGKMDVYCCVARLKFETKYFQLFSTMEGLILQHDQYGNLISESYEFDLEVVEKGTKLSMPLADLLFKDISRGTQAFSFTLHEPGNFTLLISDKDEDALISNTPYDFTVYIGTPIQPLSSSFLVPY